MGEAICEGMLFQKSGNFHYSGAQCWLDFSLGKEYPVTGLLDKNFP
jgi:hypothetical protein